MKPACSKLRQTRQNNSPSSYNSMKITKAEIEDELMILDEEETKVSIEELAESITQSLAMSYPNSNATDIKLQVIAHLEEMYGQQVDAGAKQK